MKLLEISEVAKSSGVAASTLRYYEEIGLIESAGRRGLKRLFEPGILQRLALINLGKLAGFSLDDIAAMFAPDGKPSISRDKLKAKADELDSQIRKLSDLSRLLRHTAECTAPSHMECPRFLKLLHVASRPARAKQTHERKPPCGTTNL